LGGQRQGGISTPAKYRSRWNSTGIERIGRLGDIAGNPPRLIAREQLCQPLARQLYSALTEVETLLASARVRVALNLFYNLPGTINPHLSYLNENETQKLVYFVAELKRLRKACAQALDPGVGYHPNYDLTKHSCAKFAHGLMQVMSGKKIAGTKDGAFRAIAGLLYEAASGRQEADLKRACDSVLRESRASKLGTD
jgi:hypothetical protein